MDRDGTPAAAKPELVYEMPQGTVVAACQPAGPNPGRFFRGAIRDGMMQGFSLGSYIKLVDYTGRLFRQGKASISLELAGIFDRLGCTRSELAGPLEKLRDGRLLGRYFVTTRAKLREIAERLGMRRLVNVAGDLVQMTRDPITSNGRPPVALP